VVAVYTVCVVVVYTVCVVAVYTVCVVAVYTVCVVAVYTVCAVDVYTVCVVAVYTVCVVALYTVCMFMPSSCWPGSSRSIDWAQGFDTMVTKVPANQASAIFFCFLRSSADTCVP